MNPDSTEPKGIIGRSYRDGWPVIWKFVNKAPTEDIRLKLPWLTVISWRYDGAANNGMPISATNDRMVLLEQAITEGLEEPGFCQHTFSKTGGNLKELIYYVHDRDEFIDRLNTVLRTHERYPIQIDFYEDPDWTEHSNTRSLFTKPAPEST